MKIKEIIDREYEDMLPKNYATILKNHVFQAKKIDKHWEQKLSKENIFMVCILVFLAIVVYFLGFDRHYRLSISIQGGWARTVALMYGSLAVFIVFLVMDYYDRKKIALI